MKRLKELEAENARLRRAVSDLTLDKMILAEGRQGKLSKPRPSPRLRGDVMEELGVSERRACRVRRIVLLALHEWAHVLRHRPAWSSHAPSYEHYRKPPSRRSKSLARP